MMSDLHYVILMAKSINSKNLFYDINSKLGKYQLIPLFFFVLIFSLLFIWYLNYTQNRRLGNVQLNKHKSALNNVLILYQLRPNHDNRVLSTRYQNFMHLILCLLSIPAHCNTSSDMLSCNDSFLVTACMLTHPEP